MYISVRYLFTYLLHSLTTITYTIVLTLKEKDINSIIFI